MSLIACEYSSLLLSLSRKLNPKLNSQILREKLFLGQSLIGIKATLTFIHIGIRHFSI